MQTRLSGEWMLAKTPLRDLHNRDLPDPATVEVVGPVQVPGNIHVQLGIAEPFKDLPEVTDVNQSEWLYSREFATPAEPGRVFLRFDATDYFADLWVNGVHVGQNEGMYVDWEVDVTDVLNPAGASNELVLSLSCPWRPPGRMDELQSATYLGARNPSTEYMKGVHIFHWDGWPFRGFALLPFGLWQDVWLEVRDGVTAFRAAAGTVAVGEDSAEVEVSVEFWNAGEATEVPLSITVAPENFEGAAQEFAQTVTVGQGYSDVVVRITVDDPQLWWTWDSGPQNLYRLTANGAQSTFGIRTVYRDPDTLATYLNGKRIFLRGTWNTSWAFEANPTDEDLAREIEMLVESNCNHTVFQTFIPRPAMYDACDRFGILVHNGFPFHQFGPHKLADKDHPRRGAFLAEASRQCERILRKNRGHASIAMWAPFAEVRDDEGKWIWGDYTEIADSILALVAKLDVDAQGHPSFCDFGEQHLWEGAIYGEFSDHYDENHKFISEYGTPALPIAESMRDILPAQARWDNPEGLRGQFKLPIDVDEYSFIWGHEHQAFAMSVEYWLRHVDRTMPTFDRWVDASGWYQRFGIRYCTETYRRKRYNDIAGTRMWSFRDASPGGKCSVLDYWMRPKMGFEGLREAYQPVLISVDDRWPLASLPAGSPWERDVHVINDLQHPQQLVVTGTLFGVDGSELQVLPARELAVAPDSAEVFGVSMVLPDEAGAYLLRLEGRDASGELITASDNWLKTVPAAFAPPVRVLLWGQARYNAPIAQALAEVPGIEITVYDESVRNPRDESWCDDLLDRFDVVWLSGWERLVHRFSAAELRTVRAAVEGGLGLIHTGGQGSFHGGDSFGAQLDATPFRDVLPVALRRIDYTWDVLERPIDDQRAREELGVRLAGMRNFGYHRTAPLEGSTVLATIDGDPLLVTGSFGKGATVVLTAGLVKARRGLFNSSVEGVNPVELPDPRWELADLREYGLYWRHNSQLAIGMIAAASRRSPTHSPGEIEDVVQQPVFELLAELPASSLTATVRDVAWDDVRKVSRGVVVVENTGEHCARLVRGSVLTDEPNRRFLDGWIDLMPGESGTLRFEVGVAADEVGPIEIAAQNVAAVQAERG